MPEKVSLSADALRALESLNYPEWPDVLISDIALPDEDGYSVIRQVRALEEMRHTELARLYSLHSFWP